MTKDQLIQQIHNKKSFLCIGLDVDINKIPKHLLDEEDPIFAFNKAIIDATHQLCVAYKPNTAFYEAYGLKGWRALEKTVTVSFPTFKAGAEGVRALSQSGLNPSNARLVDAMEAFINGLGDGQSAMLILGFESHQRDVRQVPVRGTSCH